jgi:hypothetical protein
VDFKGHPDGNVDPALGDSPGVTGNAGAKRLHVKEERPVEWETVEEKRENTHFMDTDKARFIIVPLLLFLAILCGALGGRIVCGLWKPSCKYTASQSRTCLIPWPKIDLKF